MITSFEQLIAFLKRFHRHWMEDPSLPAEQVPAFVPPPLALLHRELGALISLSEEGESGPFNHQDYLVPVRDLALKKRKITFAWENQGNWAARCRTDREDPSVYSNSGYHPHAGKDRFARATRSLQGFLTSFCLREAVFSCPHLAGVDENLTLDQILAVPMQPLWLDGPYVYTDPCNVYVSEDETVLALGSTCPWIGSRARPLPALGRPGVQLRVLR